MSTFVRKQGAWGLWWLTMLTLSIYYFLWYNRINRELAGVLGIDVPANGRWWNQLIPFWNIVGLWSTAKRVNAANAALGSPTRVSPFVATVMAPIWFSSHTRYLQRRINIVHDIQASRSAMSGQHPGQAIAS